MNRSQKGLMVCLLVIISLAMVKSKAIAQVGFGFPPLG